jgi:hypothetical protein
MRRIAAHACLSLLGACQPNPPPAEQQPLPAPSTALTPPPPVTAPPSAPEPPPPGPPRVEQPPDGDPAPAPTASYTPGPLAATAIADGVLLVWSRHDSETNKSEILGLQLDDRGDARGEPRLIRRTSGNILDLAVDRRDGTAWIAWVAQLSTAPDLPRALIAAIQIEPDLSAMRAPITLGQFVANDLDTWPDRDLVDVLDLADDAAAIAATGTDAECTDIVTDRKTRCFGFDLHWLRADGTHTVAGKAGTDGGDPGTGELVDVGTGVLFDIWAWHGGATHTTIYAPYQLPLATPPFPIHQCRPPFTRSWTGSELVTICPDDYSEDDCAGGIASEPGACTRVHTAVRDDRAVPLREQTRRCAAGRPVLDLRTKGGKIRLDPHAAGASIDLDLGVWTGTHAVKLTSDGARELWTCNKSGEFVPAEAPGDVLSLSPDPSTLKSVPTRAP